MQQEKKPFTGHDLAAPKLNTQCLVTSLNTLFLINQFKLKKRQLSFEE